MREGDFWSRRRAAVEREEQAEIAAKENAHLKAQHDALEVKTDDEILTELKLPVPETLQSGDDFSVFMAKAVPDRIRRRALRVLWRANPILANVDELVDYGENFTDSATVVENLQTAYQVGRGMLKHVEEMARQAQVDEAAGDRQPEVESDTADLVAEDAAPPQEETVAVAEQNAPVEDAPQPDFEEAVPRVVPRRMQFRTEELA